MPYQLLDLCQHAPPLERRLTLVVPFDSQLRVDERAIHAHLEGATHSSASAAENLSGHVDRRGELTLQVGYEVDCMLLIASAISIGDDHGERLRRHRGPPTATH